MDKEKFLSSGLLHQHILGLTDPEEDQIVASFLHNYPELKEEVSRVRKGIHRYALNQGIPPLPDKQSRDRRNPPKK